MIKRIIAVILLLAGSALADPALLERANKDYTEGKYALAAEGYRELLAGGWRTGEVYYNLGNAYQKLGDKGRARAAYENAMELIPRDRDLRRNRGELLATLADRSVPPGRLEQIASWFTRTELTVLATVFYWVGAGLVLLQMRRRSAWRTAALCACALGVLFFGSLWVARERATPGVPAAVIPAEVSLYDGPGRDFEAGMKLPAGSLVYVLSSRGDWREVAALGRVTGWLRAEELERVEP